MRPRAALTLLLFVAAALADAPTAAGRDAQREAVERHVFVTVTDARGQPVEGLTPADFVVREDGVVREVLRVAPTAPPSHVALLADNSGASAPLLIELRAGLLKFVLSMTALPAPPSMSLITVAERPATAVPYTTSDIVLERGIERLFPRPNSGSYLLDAVVEACEAFRKMGAERPAVVAFAIEASPAFSNHLHTRVADALKEAGASLWTIQVQENRPADSLEARERDRLVNDVTAWSGGRHTPVLSPQGIEQAFVRTSAAMLGRYDVTYGRPDALIPPDRLTVETRNRQLRVAAPRWAVR